MVEPTTIWIAVQAAHMAYKGGRAAYRHADKKVAAYAAAGAITKTEAWSRVRAEAARRGDESAEKVADLMLTAGPLGAALVPGGTILYPAAAGWRAMRRRRQRKQESI